MHSSWWHLWAKTAAQDRWHALPCHLLDVAATAEELWDRLPRASRGPARQLSLDEAPCKKAVVFLAAAHDVGKANRFFQAKDRFQYDRLQGLSISLPPHEAPEPCRHGQATGAYLKLWLTKRWGWDSFAAEAVALAVGGHHGTFSRDTKLSSLQLNEEPWKSLVPDLLDALADTLHMAKFEPTAPLNPFLGWLSGFVCVADWLGSHEEMTVWETRERDLAEYLAEARVRARRLLDELQWHPLPPTPRLSLDSLLPEGSRPNSLQRAAAEVASEFSLAIVEAPTGEGKTEAAFALAEPARSTGTGIYFALPTMATANGLFERVRRYLRSAFDSEDFDARLLHSQAWLFRTDASTVPDPGEEGQEQDTQAQDWFVGAKRGLLAPFGVGTIDQSLVAALRAKHGFVRLFALAGKTVVIDEVHAYDVYMADLMDVLLGWLRVMGCRAVLLSATLPKARREALLRAWGVEGEIAEAEYPCLTWVDAAGKGQARSFDVRKRKPLSIAAIPADTGAPWERGAARLLERVQSVGGLGALILNTVRDAQAAYDWLVQQDMPGVDLDLFHARFTAHDRDIIEKRVLERFGKQGRRDRPAVLLATQVVEQSLDLDFDHMVSALAPIDLLIQRAGRLHRHRRRAGGTLREDDGADERPDPVLEVLSPCCDDTGLPVIEDPVYSPDVLMRTLRHLDVKPQIACPSDVAEAVEAVYGEAERHDAQQEWEGRLRELEAKTSEKSRQQSRKAEQATIGRANDEDSLIIEAFLDLDENNERHGSQLAARTRLEERPSIAVALLREEQGRLVTVHGTDASFAREAVLASVRLSPPFPLWEALRAIEPLSAWQGKGALSQTRPLILVQGRTQLGGYEISYDARRGVGWRKCDADI